MKRRKVTTPGDSGEPTTEVVKNPPDLFLDLMLKDLFLYFCCIAVSMGELSLLIKIKCTSKRYYNLLNDKDTKRLLFKHCIDGTSIFKSAHSTRNLLLIEGFKCEWHAMMFYEYPNGTNGVAFADQFSKTGTKTFSHTSKFSLHFNFNDNCQCDDTMYKEMAMKKHCVLTSDEDFFHTDDNEKAKEEIDKMLSNGVRFFNSIVAKRGFEFKDGSDINNVTWADVTCLNDLKFKLTKNIYKFRIGSSHHFIPVEYKFGCQNGNDCYTCEVSLRKENVVYKDRSAGLHPLFLYFNDPVEK